MPWENTISKIDAVVGAVIGTIIAMNILFGSGFLLFESVRSYPTWQKGLCAVFFVWCVITEMWFILMTWGVIMKQEAPAALAVAMRQPLLPGVLRPIASLWWFFQFMMGLVWGIVLSVAEKDMPTWASAIVAVVISGFAYLTFGYLLLTITAFTKRHDLMVRVWGWRGRWAIAHGLIVLATKVLIAPHVDLK
jgi:hypothetical protein